MIIGTHLFIPSYALCESYNNTLIKVDFDHALENELEKWKEGIYDDPSDVKTDSIKNIYKTWPYADRRTDSIGLKVYSTVYLGVVQVSGCGLRILLYAICSYIDAISEQLNLKKRLRNGIL